MPVHTTTDHATITELLDEVISADPVRGTVLGTIRNDLHDPAWCAYSSDHAVLAVRSDQIRPVVLSGDWPQEELPALVDALRDLPDLAGVSAVEQTAAALEAALPQPVSRMATRLFRLDSLTEPPDVPGTARRATAADRDLVLGWYQDFHVEADASAPMIAHRVVETIDAGQCWLWVDGGRPVSLATRRPVVGGSARVGPVYTPREHRGHGYGSAVTAAATADILTDGAIPVLFTDLANPTSNAIYPRLGYRPVEDRTIIRFS